MIYAGLRIGELRSLAARPRDQDREADRRIRLRGALQVPYRPSGTVTRSIKLGYVVPSCTGRRQYETKVRENMLKAAVTRANKNLAAVDLPPLPERLAPLSLRRTFARSSTRSGSRRRW